MCALEDNCLGSAKELLGRGADASANSLVSETATVDSVAEACIQTSCSLLLLLMLLLLLLFLLLLLLSLLLLLLLLLYCHCHNANVTLLLHSTLLL